MTNPITKNLLDVTTNPDEVRQVADLLKETKEKMLDVNEREGEAALNHKVGISWKP